jgi:DNA-directed RNA polymerase specialized sigma24 family protein
MAAGNRDRVTTRPGDVAGGFSAGAGLGSVPAPWDADRAVTVMFGEHYRCLVRMAALLVGDVAAAEAVVQDCFVAMHGAWRRLKDGDKALSYLRHCLVSRSRSALRHQMVTGRSTPQLKPGVPSASRAAPLLPEPAVAGALRALPVRQREALVLVFYGGLTEAQAAAAMGIRPGMVHDHLGQAVERLRAVLGAER